MGWINEYPPSPKLLHVGLYCSPQCTSVMCLDIKGQSWFAVSNQDLQEIGEQVPTHLLTLHFRGYICKEEDFKNKRG